MEIQICNLGKISHGNALELQRKLLALRQQQKSRILLLEHPPVLTIGKKVRIIKLPIFWFPINFKRTTSGSL